MSCTCTSGGGNTGVPFCSSLQSVPYSHIIVPKYVNGGTLNYIDLVTDTLNPAFFEGKINEANWQDRWYPLPYMENVENVREDSLSETSNAGNIYRIKQGARQYTAQLFEKSPQFLGKLESWRCKEVGVFELDVNGTLAGTLSADGTKLYPRYVLKGSFDPTLTVATDTTVQKIQYKFQYAQNVEDSEIGIITSENLGGANLLDLNGLFDLKFLNTASTINAVTVDVVLDYGDVMSPNKVTGLSLADFTVYNNTDLAPEIVTVAEVDGSYTLTFDTPIVLSDEILVTVSKIGLNTGSFTVVAS